MDESKPEASVADRRSTERVAKNRPMSMTLEAEVIKGHSRDISGSSVFFLADSELRMQIRFTDEGSDGVVRHGHLIRYQRMPDGGSGWAVQFDD